MTIDQALVLARALIVGVEEALLAGSSTVSLTPILRAADDAAREELAIAVARAEDRVGGSGE